MHHLTLTRRTQRYRWLPRLLARRHLLLHRSAGGVAILEALGVRRPRRAAPVWVKWNEESDSSPVEASWAETPRSELAPSETVASAPETVPVPERIAALDTATDQAPVPSGEPVAAPEPGLPSIAKAFVAAGKTLLARLAGRSGATAGPGVESTTTAPSRPPMAKAPPIPSPAVPLPRQPAEPVPATSLGSPDREPEAVVAASAQKKSVEPNSIVTSARQDLPASTPEVAGPRQVEAGGVLATAASRADRPTRHDDGLPITPDKTLSEVVASEIPAAPPSTPAEPAREEIEAATSPATADESPVSQASLPNEAEVPARPPAQAVGPPAQAPAPPRVPDQPQRIRVAEERRPRRPPPEVAPGVRRPRAAVAEEKLAEGKRTSLEVDAPVESGALFAPRTEGRAAGDWLERLRNPAPPETPAPEVTLPEAHRVSAPARAGRPAAPAPPPIAESARRFLRPLVGIDPSEVKIHRGPEAERAAASRSADAVARGDEVAVGIAGSDREPETLGLLAHELTHVARHRAPRFIPPIARGNAEGAAPQSDDEEAVALRVESRVRAMARREADARIRVTPPRATGGEGVEMAPALEAPVASVGAETRAEPAAAPNRDRSEWGSLPAPWEPLPDFFSAPSWPAGSAELPAGAGASQGEGSGSAALTVHRAATDRQQEPEGGSGGQPAGGAGQPSPDIDQLARKVYAVLRRRLAAERRRDG